MQPVVQHTHFLYGLGWCIGWLQFIKAVRCQAGNLCQVKKCTQYVQCTQCIQWHSNLETRKVDMKRSGKLIVGKYDSLFFYCFFLCVALKVPTWFLFWLQNLDDTLISPSSAFPFPTLKARLNLAINVNVRFELWFILMSCIDSVF